MTPEWAGVLIAAIGAVGACVAAVFGGRNHRKLDDIQGAVNGNLAKAEKALAQALKTIERLRAQPKRR